MINWSNDLDSVLINSIGKDRVQGHQCNKMSTYWWKTFINKFLVKLKETKLKLTTLEALFKL